MGSEKHKHSRLLAHKAQEKAKPPKETKSSHEFRHLRRIVKLKPRARRHMSEAFDEEVTEKDLRVIQEVVESLNAPRVGTTAEGSEERPETFACLRCGSMIEVGSERCPSCGVLYVPDPMGAAIEGPSSREDDLDHDEIIRLLKEGSASCVHLDVTSGKINYLSNDDDEPDFGLECHHCGAVTEFGTDRCPMCGKHFEDAGLIALLDGLKFDPDNDERMNCPACGEDIVIVGGVCPKCHELIRAKDPHSLEARVLPLLEAKNIIFVHLDATTGDLQFVQKLVQRKAEVQAIHLESLGTTSVEHELDWRSLHRI